MRCSFGEDDCHGIAKNTRPDGSNEHWVFKVALDMDMLKDVIVDRSLRVPVQIMLAARADGGVTRGHWQSQ